MGHLVRAGSRRTGAGGRQERQGEPGTAARGGCQGLLLGGGRGRDVAVAVYREREEDQWGWRAVGGCGWGGGRCYEVKGVELW